MPRKKQPDDEKPQFIGQAEVQKAMLELLAGNDPGPLFSDLKRPRKAGSSYALKLTQQQRESLITCTQIKGTLKKKIEDAGQGTQVVKLTRRQVKSMNDELRQAVADANVQHQKRLVAVMGKVANLLVEDYTGLFVQVSLTRHKTAPKKGTRQRKRGKE